MKKHQMDDNSRQALVSYRLKRAMETIGEAKTMLEHESYNGAINRIYYACFYAALGLMAHESIEAKSHDGVKRMLGLHFIATKKFDNRYNIIYSQIFNARISGDYDDYMTFDKPTAELYVQNGIEFIDAVSRYITNSTTSI